MKDGGDGWMLGQDGGDVIIGSARVDDRRQARLRRDHELRLEGAALFLAGRVIVVVIETGFTDGHNPAVLRQAAKPVAGIRIPSARIMRVNTGGDRQAGLPRGKRQSDLGVGVRLAYHHNASKARSPGTLQDGGAIRVEGWIGEMAVGVD
jgi:hypothetical protein